MKSPYVMTGRVYERRRRIDGWGEEPSRDTASVTLQTRPWCSSLDVFEFVCVSSCKTVLYNYCTMVLMKGGLEISSISWLCVQQLPCPALLSVRVSSVLSSWTPAASTAFLQRRHEEARPRPPTSHEYNLRSASPNTIFGKQPKNITIKLA
jgi:hypothetical protein